MSPARVVPCRDGPYLVRGEFDLVDQEGNVIETRRGTIALCRCGASRTKPFCDGTHKAIGFKAPSDAADQPLRPKSSHNDGNGANGNASDQP